MVFGKILATLIIALLIITFTGCIREGITIDSNEDNTNIIGSNISIACWNLQIFGPSKALNDTLLDYYAEKLDDFDIFIVQEIRDGSRDAIKTLALKFPEHQYILSNRAGQSSSKEQYAVFYNNQATLIESYDYQEELQEDMQRPPLKVTFRSNNWTFTLFTIHTQPKNVPGELSVLETIVGDPMGDTIILGDLNADGSYYDEENIDHFVDWNWVINNDVDTTIATSDNTYDRIIINKATENNLISFGVMNDVNIGMSDHYLIYGYFYNEKE